MSLKKRDCAKYFAPCQNETKKGRAQRAIFEFRVFYIRFLSIFDRPWKVRVFANFYKVSEGVRLDPESEEKTSQSEEVEQPIYG